MTAGWIQRFILSVSVSGHTAWRDWPLSPRAPLLWLTTGFDDVGVGVQADRPSYPPTNRSVLSARRGLGGHRGARFRPR